jgi:hypothetical protein
VGAAEGSEGFEDFLDVGLIRAGELFRQRRRVHRVLGGGEGGLHRLGAFRGVGGSPAGNEGGDGGGLDVRKGEQAQTKDESTAVQSCKHAAMPLRGKISHAGDRLRRRPMVHSDKIVIF